MWTNEQMVEVWGARCEDYEKDCACCLAWSMFDEIERLRGEVIAANKAIEDSLAWVTTGNPVTKPGS